MSLAPRDARRVPGEPLLRDERGATTVEYTVVLVLVAILSIAAWQAYQRTIEADASAEYQTFGYPPAE